MPELENPPDPGVPKHLQEYFSGIAGFPPKNDEEQPLTLVTARHEAGTHRVTSDAEEIQRLRRLVQEKDHALFRAVLSGTDLQQQLEQATAESESLKGELAVVQRPPEDSGGLSPETQQEVNRQRKEWLRIQKTLEREHAQRKAELVQVRGEAYRFQQQLEIESRARRMEAAQFSAKIATLERSLSTANNEVSKAYAAARKVNARRTAGIALASIVVLVSGVAAWTQVSARTTATASSPMAPQARSQETPQPIQTGFQRSLGRLNEALSSFRDRSPEEVLREVRLHSPDHSVCSFQWNNGQPALLVGGQGLSQSLAGALSSCAVAVEHYRP